MRFSARVLLLLAAVAMVGLPRAIVTAQRALSVEPSEVRVKMLYHPTSVRVTASVPARVEVAILLVGAERHLALKRKGKALGVIWMNVGDVAFDSIPDVYLLSTTCGLDDLAEPDVLARMNLGYAALAARSGAAAGPDSPFGELVRLEERDGLWRVAEGAVTVEPSTAGGAVATAAFVLPARAAVGEYRVLVYTFANDRAELAGESRVRVAQGGVAAFIAGLSRSHGLLYGILAVLIAAAAGLLTGVIFGRGARKVR